MKNNIEIGIVGAPINNGNLGCQALTYSIVSLLDEIARRNQLSFFYHVFEWGPDRQLDAAFCRRLGMNPGCLDSVRQGVYHDFLRKVKHYRDSARMKNTIKKCDFLIDLTEGDSFTDIYGQKRFDDLTDIKELIEKTNGRLILGSQTYGPFRKKENEERAAFVIKKAAAVFARDQLSGDYVRKISGVDPVQTCDLAFRLPFASGKSKDNAKRTPEKIGLNVSGLLVSNSLENTQKSFSLKTNYDAFVSGILEYLTAHHFEIHLIGHVQADYDINKELKKKYPNVILAPEFDNPMDAKSYISGMDLFIGSRMHATIGALTSNTPVVPVAYSRKFTGLFATVDYPYVVDLQKADTESAVKQVEARIEAYEETQNATDKSYHIAVQKNEECYKAYEKVINKILGE